MLGDALHGSVIGGLAKPGAKQAVALHARGCVVHVAVAHVPIAPNLPAALALAAQGSTAAGYSRRQRSSCRSILRWRSSTRQQRQSVWVPPIKRCWQQHGGPAQPGGTVEAPQGQAHA